MGTNDPPRALNALPMQVVSLGRALLGGNGIIVDFNNMKAFCDMEALYTYEGSYEINCLVTGRFLTGHGAFRPAAKL